MIRQPAEMTFAFDMSFDQLLETRILASLDAASTIETSGMPTHYHPTILQIPIGINITKLVQIIKNKSGHEYTVDEVADKTELIFIRRLGRSEFIQRLYSTKHGGGARGYLTIDIHVKMPTTSLLKVLTATN